MGKYVTIKCPSCGNEMYADESKQSCECTNCGNTINISSCIVKGQEITNEDNANNINVNNTDTDNNAFLNSLKTGLLGAFDTMKTESKKAIDDTKENMLKSAEERKKDKEDKLKAKLAEKEKQARLKLETEEKIRQMKREAEEKKRQEKEQRKAIKRAKRKAFFGKLKILFIILLLCFAAYRVYQLVDYNLQTERHKELAEIEARKQIEIASITEAEKKKRHDKNEFDINKNEKISIRLFDFSVPVYWNENKKNINAYDGLAEVGGKIAELQISSLEDTDIVSFDVLKKETLNCNMQNVFTQSGWFEGATFIEYERISNDTLDGYVYSYSAYYKGNDSTIKVFCFPSFEDNRWYYVVLQESSNTSYSYITDFYKIINSIKRNVNSAVKE